MKRPVLIAVITAVVAVAAIFLYNHISSVRSIRVSGAHVFEDYYTAQSIPLNRFSGGLKGSLDVLMDKSLEHNQGSGNNADYLPVIISLTSVSGRKTDYLPLEKPWAPVAPVDLYGNSTPVFMVEQYITYGAGDTAVPVTEFIEVSGNKLAFLEYTSQQTGKRGRMSFVRSRNSAWATVNSGRGPGMDILQAIILTGTPGAVSAEFLRFYYDGKSWIMLSVAGRAAADSDFNTYFPPDSAFPEAPRAVASTTGAIK
ncbi:MAG: hypothetical protein LLG37_11460 [Spirochaetia bacterium]|nr:hypothetical protein [Spirochaetia bacterium]